MDVVIPYKQSSSDELQYAVYSLRNIKGLGNINVILDTAAAIMHSTKTTDKAEISQSDIQLPYWSKRSVYHNTAAKYFYACGISGVSEDFIASNDDIYILEPWKPEYYHRGALDDHIKTRSRSGTYTKSLITTKEWLESRNLPTLSYELHIPFIFNKCRLLNLLAEADIANSSPMQIRSLYGNYYNVGGDYMEDTKIASGFIGKPILSSSDVTFRGALGRYVKQVLR